MKNILRTILIRLLILEAKLVLRKYNPKIAVVAGDVGKTTTKDLLYAVSKKHVSCRKNPKSFNSEIGLPLTILGAKNAWGSVRKWTTVLIRGLKLIAYKNDYPELLILELGDRKPGDSKFLAEWLRPDILVLTHIDDVPTHVEFFTSIEGSRKEKTDIVEQVADKGTIIYQAGDKNSLEIIQAAKREDLAHITYGPHQDADIRLTNIETTIASSACGSTITITAKNTEHSITLPEYLGQGIGISVSAAIAFGVSQDVSIESCLEALAQTDLDLARGRLRAIPGVKRSIIIDDSYNAGVASTELALSTLDTVPAAGRRIAILADMLELGEHTKAAHERIGARAAETCDCLVAVGTHARIIAETARKQGMSPDKVFTFSNSREAGKFVEQMIRPGDVVLVKGSQGLRMERAVQEMMLHPESREALLVRQEKEWQRR